MVEDEEDEEEEEDEVVTDRCGLCPFLLATQLESDSGLASGVRAGDGVWAATVPGACGGSTVAGEGARAGEDCLDSGCCLDFSSPNFSGGVSLFLRRGSSFSGAGVGLRPDSETSPFPGMTPSFFSDNLFFFLSFLHLPCFESNIFEGIHCKF